MWGLPVFMSKRVCMFAIMPVCVGYTHTRVSDKEEDQEEVTEVGNAIRGTTYNINRINKSLQDQQRDPNVVTLAGHQKIVARTRLMMEVSRLLQEGGFGDSSDEEDEDDPEVQEPPLKIASRAATSQTDDSLETTSKASGHAATSQPLAPQARAFMEEMKLEELADFETNAILECCYASRTRRLSMYPSW